jgi:hypothetical protein
MEFPTNLPPEYAPKVLEIYKELVEKREGHPITRSEFYDQITDDIQSHGWWSDLSYYDIEQVNHESNTILIKNHGWLKLRPREMQTLIPMMKQPHRVIDFESFVKSYGEYWHPKWKNSIVFNIRQLRKKLEPYDMADWIRSAQNAGYYLQKPD